MDCASHLVLCLALASRGKSEIFAPVVVFGPSRFVLGLMNGITPAVRTILHDICGTEHVVQAFAYIDGMKRASPGRRLRLRTCVPQTRVKEFGATILQHT